MKNYKVIMMAMVALLVLTTGCAKHMTVQEAYSLPEAPEVKEGGQRQSYNVVVVPMNQILSYAGRYGIRHDLYVQSDTENEKPVGDNFIGFRHSIDGQPVIIVLDYEKKLDITKKAFIGSRDNAGQYHQYSLDGKNVFGQYEQQFDWEQISSIKETEGVQVWQDIQPGDERDEVVVKAMADITAKVRDLMIPGKWEMVMKRVGIISHETVFLAMATDLSSFFFFVGIQYFPLIMEVAGVGAPDGPQLEQALVTNYDLAKALATELQPIKDAVSGHDSVAAAAYLESLREYNRVLQEHEAVLNEQKRLQEGYQNPKEQN
jgi:hypothetical protein